MTILNQLTIKNIKLNKRITTLIIVGIVISTIFFNVIFSMCTSILNMGIKEIKEIEKNNYHILFENVPVSEINNFKNNKNIEDFFIIQSMRVIDSNGFYFGAHSGAYTKGALENLYIRDIRGRLPENENEVLIGDMNQWYNGEFKYKIGDFIDVEIETSSKYDEEMGENIHITQNKTYKIVGISEKRQTGDLNLSSEFESKDDYFITYIDDDRLEGNVDLYVRFNKEGLKDLYKTIANILNIGEKNLKNVKETLNNPYINSKDLSQIGAKYNIFINRDLIGLETNKINNYYILNGNYSTSRFIIYSITTCLILIFITTVFLKNNLYILFNNNIKQYGMLRSIGATKKQIRKIIFSEATLLMIIAVPLGLILGIFTSIIFINVNNFFLEKIVFVEHIFTYSFSYIHILNTIILEAIIIYYSAFIVTQKISKITPMDLMKNSMKIKSKLKKIKAFNLISKKIGTYGELASKNINRNKKIYKPIMNTFIVSIAIFIILFNCNNMKFEEKEITPYSSYGIQTEYNLYLKTNAKNLDKIYDILNSIIIEDYSIIKGRRIEVDEKNLTKEFSDYISKEIQLEELLKYEKSINVFSVGNEKYKQYVKELGVNLDEIKDKAIFVDNKRYIEDGGKKIKKFDLKKKYMFEGIEEETNKKLKINIGCVVEKPVFGLYNYEEPYLIVSDEAYNNNFKDDNVTIYLKSSKPKDIKKIVENALKDDYYELVNMFYTEMAWENYSNLLKINYGSFAFISYLIIFINLICTIAFNLELRNREFAVYKSIGMTKKELEKMVKTEYLFIGIDSIYIGLFIGILISCLIYFYYSKVFFVTFIKSPIIGIGIAVIVTIVIISIITEYSIHKLNKQSIIETIRNENI